MGRPTVKQIFYTILAAAVMVGGCTKSQREGWEKRFERLGGEEKSAAPVDTLNAESFALGRDRQDMLALQVAVAKMQQIAEVLEFPAELQASPDRQVSIRAPIRGKITQLPVKLGSRVEKNALLAIIENPQNLGQKYRVRAPMRGVVTRRRVSPGEWVSDGAELMQLINNEQIDGVIRLYEDELARVEIGQPVTFICQGQQARGRIYYIAPTLDARTRTVEARAVLNNPAGRLKTHAYATARIQVGKKIALVVPQSAVLHQDTRFIVFVRKGDQFEKRYIEPGLSTQGWVEIRSGLKEGEYVVTQGAFELKNLQFTSKGGEEEEDEE